MHVCIHIPVTSMYLFHFDSNGLVSSEWFSFGFIDLIVHPQSFSAPEYFMKIARLQVKNLHQVLRVLFYNWELFIQLNTIGNRI